MAIESYIELLRHGRTTHEGIFRGRLDHPLSPAGHAQMKASVVGHNWSRIISSPLSRCREFGESLARDQGVELTIDCRLAEYDFGEWEGRSIHSVMESDRESVNRFWTDPYTFTPPNGENFKAFNKRVLNAWKDLSRKPSDEMSTVVAIDQVKDNVLVITHGGVILSILSLVLGRKGLHGKIDVPYACISRISRATGDWPQRLLYHGIGPIRQH